jgi:biotin operon repressor
MRLSDNVLAAIAAGNCGIAGIAEALGVTRKAVNHAAQTLKKRGLIETHSERGGEISGPSRRGQYRLTAFGAAFAASGRQISPGQGERPRERTAGLRERAWWHFRAHKIASMKELLTTHAEGGERDATSNVYKYLLALERAGILQRCAQRAPARQSRGLVIWRLALDLGPKAPVWRQTAQAVFDPNSGRVFRAAEEGGIQGRTAEATTRSA